MITAAILNAILALGVIVTVVTPLVWAILTQHRDHPTTPVATRATKRPVRSQSRQPMTRPSYKSVTGRA